jgi:PAS domain S-box-containing protein
VSVYRWEKGLHGRERVMNTNILILDDDEKIRQFLGRMLKGTGYIFKEASNAEEARKLLKKQPFELILCDIGLPGESGLDFIRSVLPEYSQMAAIMVTGLVDFKFAEKALEIGVHDYITKPFERDRVLFSVNNALRRQELVNTNCSYRQDLEKMVVKRTVKLEETNSKLRLEIAERKRARDVLKESEQKYRLLVNNAGDSIFIVQDETLKFSNPKTQEITGYSAEELAQIQLINLIHPEDRDRVFKGYKRRLNGKKYPDAFSFRIIAKTGQEVWAQLNTTSITWEGRPATLNFLRDISQLKQAEEEKKQIAAQLLQSEKMASIGQLAAGVAHEINNPTGFVSSNLKTLSEYIEDISGLSKEYRKLVVELKQNSDTHVVLPHVTEQVKRITAIEKEVDIDFIVNDISELIEENLEGTERIKKIVQDLKDFAHPGEDKPKFADINQNMDSTVNVVWNELKYKADIAKDYGDLPQVQCYPQLLNQVFMNLLVNAAQSIEERGEINIKTRAENGYVEIKITDTGAGIPKENLPRVFDPFFTTKEVGKGTGLGLNVVYNIIQKHHGNIDVKSNVGKGTTFTIRIPVADDE